MTRHLLLAFTWAVMAGACGQTLAETASSDPGVPDPPKDAGPDNSLPPPPTCTADAASAWSFAFQSPKAFVYRVAKLDDDVIVLGTFQKALRFGSVHVHASEETGFLTRLDACGQPLWFQELDGDYFSMMIRPDRRITVTGAMTDEFAVLVSTFDAEGGSISETKLPTTCFSEVSLAAAADGSFVMAGLFGNIDNEKRERPIVDASSSSGFACTASSTPGLYIAKLSPSGTVIYLRAFEGTFNVGPAVVGDDGSVDITAQLNGLVDFGTGPIHGPTGLGAAEPFVLHLGPQGRTEWVRTGDGIGGDAITVAPGGQVIAAAVDRSGCPNQGLALVGLDPATGATDWSFCAGVLAFVDGFGVTPNGTVVAAGSFDGPTDLLGNIPTPGRPIYLAAFRDGVLRKQQLFGDGNQDVNSAALVGDRIVIAGMNRGGVIDFGQGKLVATGSNEEAFLAKLPVP